MASSISGTPSSLLYPAGMLNLEYTLSNGQMFRWRQTSDGWWDAIMGSRFIRIKQVESSDPDMDRFEFQTFPGEPDEEFLRTFFRLDVDLPAIYGQWQGADPYLGSLADRFHGLRIVEQRPEECLLCFMCSTANFIPRIMKAIAILSNTWGEPIEGEDGKLLSHAFPGARVLAALDPYEIDKKTGLEWRAGNLVKVAKQLAERPEGWLAELSKLSYAHHLRPAPRQVPRRGGRAR